MANNPDEVLGRGVSSSQMRGDLAPNKFDQYSANTGAQFYALSLASVRTVDYEKMEVSLLIETGETIPRLPVPMTFPGGGYRHFLGALPEPGDICVVGWGMQESGRTRQPWIVSWVIPGVDAGYDWLPTQPYSPDESGTTPLLKHQMQGVMDRRRHKLRHMEPGNVVASSSQGADLVLNESVLLANRRGNEVHLRDQDQALILRSLQQFHAGSGFRLYAGMVQRDATFLPSQMASDGVDWASSRQIDEEGNPLTETLLDEAAYAEGILTPAGVFQQDGDGTPLADLILGEDTDPNDFLKLGLFLDDDGTLRGDNSPDAIYGGKPLYRVSSTGENAAADSTADTLTEYRIELAHISDGTLPVTEQTDGFDAERLPSGSPLDNDPEGVSINSPFLEFVLGSVVGNDAFSEKGRAVYGQPLRPQIFDGDVRSPVLATGVGSPLSTHSATLMRVRPPLGGGGDPSFISFTKDGRLFSSVAGPGNTWSMEASLGAGIRLGAGTEPGGESLSADMGGSVIVRARAGRNADNLGILLSSEGGAVKIFGGGTFQEGGQAARTAPAGEGEGALPSLVLEAGTNALLKAVNTVQINGNQIRLDNAANITLGASSGLDFKSSQGISHSSNTYVQSSTGKSTYNYSGPKDSNPSNGPLREVSFTGSPATGFAGGTADKYEMLYGDRKETITSGNHETQVAVGNQTYKVGAGILKLESGSTALELTSASMSARSSSVSIQATSGAATLQATTNVTLSGQSVVFSGSSMTFTSSVPGTHTPPGGTPGGGLLTDGSLNALTGKTFKLGGTLGVPTIVVA